MLDCESDSPGSGAGQQPAAAHLEGFGSLAGVAKAKGEIFSGLPENGIAIMNADNNDWLNWQSVIGPRKVWRFSPNANNSDFTATNIHVTSHGTEFTLQTPTGSVDVLLPLPGRHNIANALAAAALSMSVGATLDAIKAGLANLKAVRPSVPHSTGGKSVAARRLLQR